MINIRNITSSFEKWRILSTSLINFSFYGLIVIFVSKYFNIALIFSRDVSGIVVIVAKRNSIFASKKLEFFISGFLEIVDLLVSYCRFWCGLLVFVCFVVLFSK